MRPRSSHMISEYGVPAGQTMEADEIPRQWRGFSGRSALRGWAGSTRSSGPFSWVIAEPGSASRDRPWMKSTSRSQSIRTRRAPTLHWLGCSVCGWRPTSSRASCTGIDGELGPPSGETGGHGNGCRPDAGRSRATWASRSTQEEDAVHWQLSMWTPPLPSLSARHKRNFVCALSGSGVTAWPVMFPTVSSSAAIGYSRREFRPGYHGVSGGTGYSACKPSRRIACGSRRKSSIT